jgi:anti-sigma-K factor RskA
VIVMKCKQYQDLLSEYIDGTLELGEQVKIERHLEDCEPCRILRDDLLQIAHFSRQLPLLTPPSAVWAGIQEKVAAERRPRIRRWLTRWLDGRLDLGWPQLAVATAAFVIVASIAVIVSRQQYPAPSAQSDTLTAQSSSAGLNLLSSAEYAEIEQKIDRLGQSVEQRKASWDPDLRLAFDRNMLNVEECLKKCRQQVRAHPSDRVSQDMMREAYLEKQRLLEGFARF